MEMNQMQCNTELTRTAAWQRQEADSQDPRHCDIGSLNVRQMLDTSACRVSLILELQASPFN